MATVELTTATIASSLATSDYLWGYTPGSPNVDKRYSPTVIRNGIGVLGEYNAVVDGGVDNTGNTDATAGLVAAIAAAAALPHRRLYLPSGTYSVSGAAGTILLISTDNFELYGDGEGKTIIQYAAGQVLTNLVNVIQTTGKNQEVHSLTFQAADTPTAALTYGSVGGGGSGYVVNDTITLAGGTFTSAAVVKVTSVSGGVINGASLNTAGSGGSYSYPGVSATSVGLYSQGSTSGAGTGATFNMSGPSLIFLADGQGAFRPYYHDIHITGAWGLNTSGGAGFTSFQPATGVNEFTTTFPDNIVAGSRTVTPVSMSGIYPGAILGVTVTNPETIVVTATTPTTFTATFANAHNTATVNVLSNGKKYGTFENIYVHDCISATGAVINSSQNYFKNIRVKCVGTFAVQNNMHGLYIQCGGNIFQGCWVEGAGAFSYHNHVGANTFPDNSGNRYIGCWSVNPGRQHMIADTLAGNGTDVTVPSGVQLNRYTQLIGCVFKCTAIGTTTVSPGTGLAVGVQTSGAIISNCVFDDACPNGTVLAMASNSSSLRQIAIGNTFLQTTTADTASAVAISAGNNSVISNNQFVNWASGNTISFGGTGGNVLITGNEFQNTGTATTSINLAASGMNNIVIANNQFTQGNGSSSSANASCILISEAGTGIQIYGNNATMQQGAHFIYLQANATGQVHDNYWTGSTGGIRFTDLGVGMDFYNNNGVYNYNNTTTNQMALDSRAGRLLTYAKSTNTATGKKAVKVDGTGIAGTGDTQWLGFALCDYSSTAGSSFVAGYTPGQIVKVACATSWTAGNVAILSAVSAGSIADSGGTIVPTAAVSYGVFQDTGGSAGDSTIVVMRSGRV